MRRTAEVKKMKRYFIPVILVIISGICLLLAIAPGQGEHVQQMQQMQQVQQVQQMQSLQPVETYKAALRPDINFGKMPLYFLANKGQVNENAIFYARASRYTLWVTKEGLVFDSVHTPASGHPSQEGINKTPHLPDSPYSNRSPKIDRDVSRLLFLDAGKNPVMVPVEETELRVNYFKGKDKSQWRCDIPTSKAVLYRRLYKNIDLKVYGIEKEIEYDWIVKPGGNPEDIRFAYKNVTGTRLDEEGNLLIKTDFGELMHKKPVGYQCSGPAAGGRTQGAAHVEVKFKKIADNTFGFEVGEYDKNHTLVIDPVVLVYSTCLGGSNFDWGIDITLDGSGCAYVAGYTYSPDFPILNEYQAYRGVSDVFVVKLDTTKNGASSLIYCTFLGGSDIETCWGIAVDVNSSGCAYVTGSTWSMDFPTLNQYQGELRGAVDAFLTKLDTTKKGTSSLIYSTYLGGDVNEICNGIAVDVNSSGCAYVTGHTDSADFPTLNQYQGKLRGVEDAFITKLDTTKKGASSLIYSTFLGGSVNEKCHGIVVDNSGCAYVTGETESANFPILNQYQGELRGAKDVFITKLDTTKSGDSSLIYSTYLGGSSDDWGTGIAMDGSGCAYVTGYTKSSGFPIRNQYQANLLGYYDAFVTKVDTTKSGASSLIYSTYLGGSSNDYAHGITVDHSGCAYVTGATWSSDFPTLDQYQEHQRLWDAFITKLDTTKNGASSLIYSTYLGGSSNDYGYGIAVDHSGCAYVTGYTDSSDFPILDEYQAYQGGTSYKDAFITRLVLCRETPSIQLNRTSLYFSAISGSSQTGSQTVSVDISGGCSLDWTASCQENWIEVMPKSAAGSALVTVSVDTAGLAAGTYSGTIFFTCDSASDSPREVTVNLTLHDIAPAGLPFGDFSTPPDVSVARGSIPVTGWALDDIEVESVKIYRDGSFYVGDAVFVDGARPDVEAAFPGCPFNYRAGWGYMLLTNFFPNGGNGNFTLSAVAFDKEGNQVTLGSKTITCDNANAVKPFGALDTPPQGGTASGNGYINFGWVLTPMPNTIPTDGSTIHVYVDGVNLGNPIYNNFRADIAALFPGYANSNGAVGYFILDTTAYANGTHTIYWTAEDDAGNIDGIGSRYFNILNQNSGSEARMFNIQRLMFNVHVPGLLPDFEPGELPIDYSTPIAVKKGFGKNIEPQKVYADDNGIITVETRELERVVLHLDDTRNEMEIEKKGQYNSKFKNQISKLCAGYLVIDNELRRLPIGSTFDNETGTFYWQPGPGFVGQYNFVFIKKGPEGELEKKIIRVVINPGL
jgi:hypothetical protein